MSISIQHLRGSESDWSSHDIVVPEGEIMLVKSGNNYKIKIGNGIAAASALPFVGVTQKTLNTVGSRLTLQNGYHYILNALPASLTINFPEITGAGFEFSACISFTVTQSFSLSENDIIYYSGDDTEDGMFSPQLNYHYNIFIFFDGNFQAVVRKVYYEPEE